jgi:hypothetical protein
MMSGRCIALAYEDGNSYVHQDYCQDGSYDLALILIDVGLTSSALGSVSLRTPFCNSASALPESTAFGSRREREKRL